MPGWTQKVGELTFYTMLHPVTSKENKNHLERFSDIFAMVDEEDFVFHLHSSLRLVIKLSRVI